VRSQRLGRCASGRLKEPEAGAADVPGIEQNTCSAGDARTRLTGCTTFRRFSEISKEQTQISDHVGGPPAPGVASVANRAPSGQAKRRGSATQILPLDLHRRRQGKEGRCIL
jgi:hypothetical protein